jgi:hypothetical protein
LKQYKLNGGEKGENWPWWPVPAVPVTQEAKARQSFEFRSLRPAWGTKKKEEEKEEWEGEEEERKGRRRRKRKKGEI